MYISIATSLANNKRLTGIDKYVFEVVLPSVFFLFLK